MSLVNSSNAENVKFVSYTGAYPNLCGGVLTLLICGKEYVFGHDYSKFESWKTDGHNPSFWSSGGNCGFTNDYSDSYVNSGEWQINVSELPEEIKQYAQEIDEVFNENVPQGCCGGCL